jgi:hypothetical protein
MSEGWKDRLLAWSALEERDGSEENDSVRRSLIDGLTKAVVFLPRSGREARVGKLLQSDFLLRSLALVDLQPGAGHGSH